MTKGNLGRLKDIALRLTSLREDNPSALIATLCINTLIIELLNIAQDLTLRPGANDDPF